MPKEFIDQPHTSTALRHQQTFYNELTEKLPNHLKPKMEPTEQYRFLLTGALLGLYLDCEDIQPLDGEDKEAFNERLGVSRSLREEDVLPFIIYLSDSKAKANDIGAGPNERIYFAELLAHTAGKVYPEAPFIEDYTDLNKKMNDLYQEGMIDKESLVRLNILFDDDSRQNPNMPPKDKADYLRKACLDVRQKQRAYASVELHFVHGVNSDWQYEVGSRYVKAIIGEYNNVDTVRTVGEIVNQICSQQPKTPRDMVEKRVKSHVAYVLDKIYRPKQKSE